MARGGTTRASRRWGRGVNPVDTWSFDGTKYNEKPDGTAFGDGDFNWRNYFQTSSTPQQTEVGNWVKRTDMTPDADGVQSGPLDWLWKKAAGEWKNIT